MSRTGRTYTRHFDLDPRQHELLGVDLGEGLVRRALILGISLLVLWNGALFLVLGLPTIPTLTLYITPPLGVTFFGAQRSIRLDRRYNFTIWALTARYLSVGHRPIICGGRRAAHRSEWLGRRARWGRQLEWFADTPLGPLVERWLGPESAIPTGSGTALRLDTRTRLYGPDAVVRAYGRKALTTNEETRP
ncbi:hypothetical protein ACFWA9_10005 [Kitasatospora sp. NPDC059973]|uniref:hypothetical protein n=1 Tax=Kitasatospora sp. NPDC059973 TaxID=3347020 RepID=UPI00367F8DC8